MENLLRTCLAEVADEFAPWRKDNFTEYERINQYLLGNTYKQDAFVEALAKKLQDRGFTLPNNNNNV